MLLRKVASNERRWVPTKTCMRHRSVSNGCVKQSAISPATPPQMISCVGVMVFSSTSSPITVLNSLAIFAQQRNSRFFTYFPSFFQSLSEQDRDFSRSHPMQRFRFSISTGRRNTRGVQMGLPHIQPVESLCKPVKGWQRSPIRCSQLDGLLFPFEIGFQLFFKKTKQKGLCVSGSVCV